jgi:hypothetical protein
MAAALVSELHGAALRHMSAELGVHVQGLAQAARLARQAGWVSNSLAKKLIQLDTAYNVCRHITKPYAAQFLKELPTGNSSELGPWSGMCPAVGSAPDHGDHNNEGNSADDGDDRNLAGDSCSLTFAMHNPSDYADDVGQTNLGRPLGIVPGAQHQPGGRLHLRRVAAEATAKAATEDGSLDLDPEIAVCSSFPLGRVVVTTPRTAPPSGVAESVSSTRPEASGDDSSDFGGDDKSRISNLESQVRHIQGLVEHVVTGVDLVLSRELAELPLPGGVEVYPICESDSCEDPDTVEICDLSDECEGVYDEGLLDEEEKLKQENRTKFIELLQNTWEVTSETPYEVAEKLLWSNLAWDAVDEDWRRLVFSIFVDRRRDIFRIAVSRWRSRRNC